MKAPQVSEEWEAELKRECEAMQVILDRLARTEELTGLQVSFDFSTLSTGPTNSIRITMSRHESETFYYENGKRIEQK